MTGKYGCGGGLENNFTAFVQLSSMAPPDTGDNQVGLTKVRTKLT
jgi:hypothetical protein